MNTKYRHPLIASHRRILQMSVFDILRRYALVESPSTQIPASVLLIDSPQCITIFDAYPKAKYHFLVLPRHPFLSGPEGEGTKSLCSVDNLDDLESVMTRTSKEARREIVGAMSSMAKEVVEMIRDEMMKTEGFTWGVDVGFHAEPSMRSVSALADCKGNVADQIDIFTCM
jgi:aprataxin